MPSTNGHKHSDVAQVSNLLYRRLPVGRPFVPRGHCGLEIRDTAGWKLLETCATRAAPGNVTELTTHGTKPRTTNLRVPDVLRELLDT